MLADTLVWRGLGPGMTWHFQTTMLNLFSGAPRGHISSRFQAILIALNAACYLMSFYATTVRAALNQSLYTDTDTWYIK